MFGEQDRFQERSRQPFIVKDLGPQTEWVRYSAPTGRAVPKFGNVLEALMGILVAAQVRCRPNYAAEILPCQTDVLVRVHFGGVAGYPPVRYRGTGGVASLAGTVGTGQRFHGEAEVKAPETRSSSSALQRYPGDGRRIASRLMSGEKSDAG